MNQFHSYMNLAILYRCTAMLFYLKPKKHCPVINYLVINDQTNNNCPEQRFTLYHSIFIKKQIQNINFCFNYLNFHKFPFKITFLQAGHDGRSSNYSLF